MTPAAPTSYEARWHRLASALDECGIEAFLASHPPDLRYLTGFSGSSGFLFHAASGPTLITDFRYEQQAAGEIPPSVRVEVAREGLMDVVGEVVARAVGSGRVGFDPERVTVYERRRLGEVAEAVEWVEVRGLVSAMRATKDPGEVERIRRAVTIAESALARVLDMVRSERGGLRERDVAARLEYELRRAGSDALPFEPIVATGARSSLPHARPGDARLAERELLLVDFGATVEGYCCDLTRTFVLGAPAEWQRELHDAVREAQDAAVGAVRAGTPAAEVDAAARRPLAEREWDHLFGHGTGHGIGLEVHEGPRLSRRSEDVLAAGNVVTVEPGVYVPGRGGVRIEDDV
ncbi:MAG: M24 family metallopeptidase, partial [Gemmatimonadota bacterium]